MHMKKEKSIDSSFKKEGKTAYDGRILFWKSQQCLPIIKLFDDVNWNLIGLLQVDCFLHPSQQCLYTVVKY